MEYQLDTELNSQLREAYSNSHFASIKDAVFNKPDSKKRNEKYLTNASNCICACMDRIDSLVEHCNCLFKEEDSEYKLCDVLSYGQTLIDCIEMLGKIFDISFDNSKESSCFNELGIDGAGCDKDYFRYIRSLCSVHPVETSRHYNYQGEESEWSPWIAVMKGTNYHVLNLMADNKEKAERADYAIVVYRNDLEFSKYIYISLDEVFLYIRKQYENLNKIIDAILNLDITLANKLRNDKILLPGDFDSYELYLDNLAYELERRGMGDYCWQVNKWKTILKSEFEDKTLNEYLEKYKGNTRDRIAMLHEKAQRMDFEEINDFDVVEFPFGGVSSNYYYSVEKTSYLLPFWEDEEFSIDEILNNVKYCGNIKRLHEILSVVEQAKAQEISINDANRFIDNTYHVDNSEWARVQIKWMEDYWLHKMDYDLSDWYVYLQLLVIPRKK